MKRRPHSLLGRPARDSLGHSRSALVYVPSGVAHLRVMRVPGACVGVPCTCPCGLRGQVVACGCAASLSKFTCVCRLWRVRCGQVGVTLTVCGFLGRVGGSRGKPIFKHKTFCAKKEKRQRTKFLFQCRVNTVISLESGPAVLRPLRGSTGIFKFIPTGLFLFIEDIAHVPTVRYSVSRFSTVNSVV